MILPPKKSIGHPDRGVDCEDALRPAFQSLISQAEAAGWTAEEIESALLNLANDNIMHALIAVDIPERTPGPDMGASAARGEEEPGNAPDDQGLRRLYA